MGSNLKDKLNARAAEAAAREEESQEAGRRYRETVLREYPRLINDLLNSAHETLDGVYQLQIVEATVNQELVYTKSFGWNVRTGSHKTDIGIGSVTVPEWGISFFDKQLLFRGAGINYFGVHGKVDVQANYQNPFVNGGIFMSSDSSNPEEWFLVIASGQRGSQLLRLTNELLAERLETYLLQKGPY